MQLLIKNLGPIKEATVDLSKDLVLFTGHNNTGKTYLSYLIFGISRKTWFSSFKTDILKKEIDEAFLNGVAQIDIKELIKLNYKKLLEVINSELKVFLPVLFANKTFFEDSEIEIKWASIENYENWILEKGIRRGYGFGKTIVQISKEPGDINLKLRVRNTEDENQPKSNIPQKLIAETVQSDILDWLFEYMPKNTQFLAAERIGVAIFARDISLNKAQAFDGLITNTGVDRAKFLTTLSKQFNQYPLPIQEAIRWQELSVRSKSQKSEFTDLADEIEQKILQGKIELSNEGDIELILSNNKRLSLSLSGSNVKSLSALTYFLQHQAKSDSVLIIDEPEINLHPDNQIILARILVKIINRGIKIIMSTHSDYMIREFNNLLMLSSQRPISTELKRRYGYADDEILNPGNVAAYYMERNATGFSTVTPIEIENGEILVKSINETINRQNVISQDIYFSLNNPDASDK